VGVTPFSRSRERWRHRASGRTPVLADGLWAPDEGIAIRMRKVTVHLAKTELSELI
jgi:hypothetical protein